MLKSYFDMAIWIFCYLRDWISVYCPELVVSVLANEMKFQVNEIYVFPFSIIN
jgi:hypothetical protein